jgi:hypothetical protein
VKNKINNKIKLFFMFNSDVYRVILTGKTEREEKLHASKK